MPQMLRNILWAVGLCLAVFGLVFAITMNKLGTESVLTLLPTLIGLAIIVCLLVSSLIQEVVTDMVRQLQDMKPAKSDEPPVDPTTENKTAAD
jgi:hypothetical protein